MSRQVLLGGVVGFLVTVTFMYFASKRPSPVNSDPPPIQRVDIQPMPAGEAPSAGPHPAPIPKAFREPMKPLPAAVRPLNLEGFDAGNR